MAVLKQFKMPRKSLTGDPRVVSKKARLTNGPRSKWVEPSTKSPLEGDDGQSLFLPDRQYNEAYGQLPEGLAVLRPKDHKGRHIDPHLPPDITQLSNDQLGTLHAQMVAMGEWLDWKVAEAEIFSANQAAYLDHLKAEIRLKKSGTVKDKDAKAINDERYIPEELKGLQLDARAKLLKARLKGYDKCAAALSREMTRRTEPHRHA